MILNIPDNAEELGFSIKSDGYRSLIVPAKGTDLMNLTAWDDVSPWLRSVVVDSVTHDVLSSGLPKFWNLNQGDRNSGERLVEALLDPESKVYFTEKMDGSLVIRSVQNGEVNFRTRGTLDGGDMLPQILKVVEAEEYDWLLDPNLCSNHSLLFEYIGPENRIVVPYQESDLVLIGCVNHTTMIQDTYEELLCLTDVFNVNVVAHYSLPQSISDLLDEVQAWEGREGIVIRVEHPTRYPETGGVWMVKLKADDYLAKHRLRFSLTTRTIREMCETAEISSWHQFEKVLADLGGDFEMAEQVRPMINLFIQVSRDADEILSALFFQVEIALSEYPLRKDFAVKFANPLGQGSKIAFLLADNRPKDAFLALRKQMLDEAFKDLEAEDLEILGKT